MASILIAFATCEGQTKKIAEVLVDALRARGHEALPFDTDHPTKSLDVEGFDAVLVGAPIHAGGYPRSVERFVRAHRALLERVPSAFLHVGLAVASRTHDGRAQTMPLVERFIERTGWHPRRIELVAGALPYSKYNFLLRFVMRRIAAYEGGDTDTSRDYEYTDWKALDRFAAEFAEGLAQNEPALRQVG